MLSAVDRAAQSRDAASQPCTHFESPFPLFHAASRLLFYPRYCPRVLDALVSYSSSLTDDRVLGRSCRQSILLGILSGTKAQVEISSEFTHHSFHALMVLAQGALWISVVRRHWMR